MKKTMKKYQTGGPKVKSPVADSTAIYKENFKIAKEDFKKNPTEKNSAKVSKTGTELIQYNKRKKLPVVIKKYGGSTKKK